VSESPPVATRKPDDALTFRSADRLADLVQKIATISTSDAAVDLDETLRALAAVTPSLGR
jgi:hypothetical protein